jgi:predicted nucleic acid-binding protein
MHLLGRVGGYAAQEELWRRTQAGQILLHIFTLAEADRMSELMDKYQNVPMDLADASLIAAAEQRGLRLIFTLDRDFYIYRLADGSALQVVP